MQDYSHLFADGTVAALVPTSQAAGNRFSRRDAAMSAPGSLTTAGREPEAEQPGPFASATTDERQDRELLPEMAGRPVLNIGGGWDGRTEIP